MKPHELSKYGLMQFHMVTGGVVSVVHLAGVGSGKLKLSADNLADIYLGKILNGMIPG